MSSYLFRRPELSNWYLRLYPPNGGKRVEKSLGTSDRKVAEILAASQITEHKKALLAKPRIEAVGWEYDLQPGRLYDRQSILANVARWEGDELPPNLRVVDGQSIFATERELHVIGLNGAVVEKRPNGKPRIALVGDGRVTVKSFEEAIREYEGAQRPEVIRTDSDSAILEDYLKHGSIRKKRPVTDRYKQGEARAVLALFKSLTEGKLLKDATYDDALLLVQHYRGQGLRGASIQKKLKWLISPINRAIATRALKINVNPFSIALPGKDNSIKRVPFNDDDMAAIKAGLGTLSAFDQLLVALLATTGMRLSEAFQVRSESSEKGVRYTVIGAKTAASKRRVPFPEVLLPYLPPKVAGPLFEGTPRDASYRLMRFIRACGITDPTKVAHSFRHRAKDRLRAAACPLDIQYEILGHEEETVAASYGLGSPVTLLREWIDHIGW